MMHSGSVQFSSKALEKMGVKSGTDVFGGISERDCVKLSLAGMDAEVRSIEYAIAGQVCLDRQTYHYRVMLEKVIDYYKKLRGDEYV